MTERKIKNCINILERKGYTIYERKRQICYEEYPELYKLVSTYIKDNTSVNRQDIKIYIWNNFQTKTKFKKLMDNCITDKQEYINDEVVTELYKIILELYRIFFPYE